MKKITLYFLLLFFINLSAQVTNQGQPMSWKFNQLNNVVPVQMTEVDLTSLQAEDAINDLRRDIPWRFGTELSVNLSMNTSGTWDQLPNGDRIWRLNIVSDGAKTLNFVFSDFFLPTGASLYFYNQERSDLLGAYTSSQNREDRQLGTWFVEGDNIWIEYYEPRAESGNGSLQISKVVHGYRSVSQTQMDGKALNDSGPCNHDVDCSVGEDFDSLKNVLKRSVAMFILGGSVCSGTLINNTDNNNAPYFLTANHCDNGNTAVWAFRFNWVSPNPSCGTTTNSTNGNFNQTTSGATKLANNSKSDVMLVHIDANLPSAWNLTWAGWNRSDTDIPVFAVGIHHPAGDIMKVCRDDQSPLKVNLNFNGNPTAQMWRINDWDLGVTEGGSSGSALFDQNGRIVGQLAGGAAACVGTNDNGQPDFYGRFATSWDFGTTDNTRLSNWLDPQGTGATSIDILNTPDFQFLGRISIFPNPATTVINVANNNSTQLTYQLYSITGQLISSNSLPFVNNTISVEALSEGVYFLQLQDKASNNTLVKRIVVKK